MKTLFASGELQAAIKQLQNNKRAGRDNIKAELLKNGTENIAKEITKIYNKISRTGKHSNEVNQRMITTIQESGRPKGSIENLRQITLPSMLRKMLAVCLKKAYNTQIRSRNYSEPSCVQTGKKYHRTCFRYKDISRKSNNFTMLYNATPHA